MPVQSPNILLRSPIKPLGLNSIIVDYMSILNVSRIVVLELVEVCIWSRLAHQGFFFTDLLQPLLFCEFYHFLDWVCRFARVVIECYCIINSFLAKLVCVKWVGPAIEQGLYWLCVIPLHCKHKWGHPCSCFHVYIYLLSIAC